MTLVDLDAERAALAAAMYGDVELFPEDFSMPSHVRIAEACERLRMKGLRPDPVLVAAEDAAIPKTLLAEIGPAKITVSQGRAYMARVSELAARRRVVEAARTVAALAERGEDWLAHAERIFDAHAGRSKRATIGELVDEAVPRLGVKREHVTLLLLPGLHLHFGDLAIVGARPGVGKSAAAAQWAVELAEKGLATRIYSLEMKRGDWLDRVLSQRTGISTDEMDRGLDEKRAEMAKAMLEGVRRLPVTVVDDATLGIEGIVADLRRFARAGGRVAFIDYLQLAVSSRKHRSRYEAVSEASRALKLAAHDTGTLVVALSQLSRSPVADGRNRPPALSDLRDSGSLEQDADDVLLIHRFEKDDADVRERLRRSGFVLEDDEADGGGRALCRIHAAKMRRGRTGTYHVWFDGRSQTFEAVDVM